jgi:hypothetical protein
MDNLQQAFNEFKQVAYTPFVSHFDEFNNSTNILCIVMKYCSYDIDYEIYEYIKKDRWKKCFDFPHDLEIYDDAHVHNNFIKLTFSKSEMDTNIDVFLNEKENNVTNIIIYYDNNEIEYKIPCNIVSQLMDLNIPICSNQHMKFVEIASECWSDKMAIFCPQEWFCLFENCYNNNTSSMCDILINVNKKSKYHNIFAIYDYENFAYSGMMFVDSVEEIYTLLDQQNVISENVMKIN